MLWQVPVNWRYYVKHQLMGAIATLNTEEVSPGELQKAFDGLLSEHPQLRARVEANPACLQRGPATEERV